MNCQRCNKPQIVTITAKCSDCCFVDYPDGREHQGYVPNDLGPIGSGDYVEMAYCYLTISSSSQVFKAI